VSATDLEAWIPRLATLKAGQRSKLRGISQPRGRQIIAGALTARAAMKAVNVRSVDICPWALREGIILHYLQTTHNESFDLPLYPLTGTDGAEQAPSSRRGSHIALVTASTQTT
jgi:exopolyphosphatase/guanosine-5'-triphosphate,3'-diphosphate pyrophosphatase